MGDFAMLENEFCPPLDQALVYAVYYDFTGEPNALQKTRDALEPLKQSALVEQNTEFDPSGNSGQVLERPSSAGWHAIDDTLTESGVSQSAATDVTSLSNGLLSVTLSDRSASSSEDSSGLQESHYSRDIEGADQATKETRLVETFPTLKPSFIYYTLEKCKGDISKATDELLNHVYFDGAGSADGEYRIFTRGIDAFAEDNTARRRRKGKSKKWRNMNSSEDSRSSLTLSESNFESSAASNRWLDGNKDVEMIATWMKMSVKTVGSIYHKQGTSVSRTIWAVLESDIQSAKNEQHDPTLEQNAVELNEEFPLIGYDCALALLKRTHPSTAASHEIAKYLAVCDKEKSLTGGIQVIPRYAPVNLTEEAATTARSAFSTPSTAVPATTASLSAARSAAFNQASAAFRRGKSDHLMKAVAGYYGQLGREYDAALKAASAEDADTLVDSQSTPTQLDLHGVTVKDATRIARESVNAWWHSLGEGRINLNGRTGVGSGYRIVTGIGNHSKEGVSRLGPAVSRMLMRDGWKVEVGSGVLVVTGVAKKK